MPEYDYYRAKLSDGWNKHVVKHVIASAKDSAKIFGVTSEHKELSLTEQLLLILTETTICPAVLINRKRWQIVCESDVILTRHEEPYAISTHAYWDRVGSHRKGVELYQEAESRDIIKFDLLNGVQKYTYHQN